MSPLTVSPVRVLLVDDHTLFRRGLTALLSRDSRLVVVGDAGDSGQALRQAQELQPDVILLDNHLPGVNGIDTLPALRVAAPFARMLMLTVSEQESNMSAAFKNGAAGYLLKSTEGEALILAIQKAHLGESVIAPEMTSKLVSAYRGASDSCKSFELQEQKIKSPLSILSAREIDVLRGVTKGSSNKEIARELRIAETTVKIHVQHIMRKLNVSSRVHAAVLASENGLSEKTIS